MKVVSIEKVTRPMVHSNTRNQTKFVVLPPSRQSVSKRFRCLDVDNRRYSELLAEMQRFRGRVYAADGAVQSSDLTADGRHKVPIDDHSWHVLSVDGNGDVCACLRYLEESRAIHFDDLWVRHAAMASSPMGWQFRQAVEGQMADARRMRMGFGEVGGWAVAQDRRWTLEPLKIILATYGLLELLGGCIGVATATFRHSSAAILRRIGLESLTSDGVELPPYFDEQYGCEMEVLRFDSRSPSPKYRDWVEYFSTALAEAPVICPDTDRRGAHDAPGGSRVPSIDAALSPGLLPYPGMA